MDTVYVALEVGGAEGDADTEFITVCVTVPVDAPDAVLAPVSLLDAEAHEVLEGV